MATQFIGEGQTMSLGEMNYLLRNGVDHMNALKDRLCVLQLERHLSPHDSYPYAEATSLKQALDIITKQREEITTLTQHLTNEQATKDACLKADNDPKYAEQFEAIACELNLCGIAIANEREKRNGLVLNTVKQKWYERLYVWVMSH